MRRPWWPCWLTDVNRQQSPVLNRRENCSCGCGCGGARKWRATMGLPAGGTHHVHRPVGRTATHQVKSCPHTTKLRKGLLVQKPLGRAPPPAHQRTIVAHPLKLLFLHRELTLWAGLVWNVHMCFCFQRLETAAPSSFLCLCPFLR
jgi:hypothetical protein